MAERPVVGVTMGDPAGIGAEVIVKAYPDLVGMADVVVVGDADAVRAAVGTAGASLSVRAVRTVPSDRSDPGTITVLDLDNVADLEYGVVRADFGRASLEYVETAIDLVTNGDIDAVVTAPINKQSIARGGGEHAGHTELFAERTGTERYSMMLVEGDLRVSHVTTHVPLREACDLVTADAVFDTIAVTDGALRSLGIEEPRIAVAGLNPHASDDGLLGDEEARSIAPAVGRAREAGIDAFGPESGDTVFARAVQGAADVVVAMYHDQGHIPVKMLGFGETVRGVNVTIGLPVVRTSVDHGTAFDIAGEGIADATSMIEAVRVAVQLSDPPT